MRGSTRGASRRSARGGSTDLPQQKFPRNSGLGISGDFRVQKKNPVKADKPDKRDETDQPPEPDSCDKSDMPASSDEPDESDIADQPGEDQQLAPAGRQAATDEGGSVYFRIFFRFFLKFFFRIFWNFPEGNFREIFPRFSAHLGSCAACLASRVPHGLLWCVWCACVVVGRSVLDWSRSRVLPSKVCVAATSSPGATCRVVVGWIYMSVLTGRKVNMTDDGLFSLADDVQAVLGRLLPELQDALQGATREWELLPSGDIGWYGTPRGMATSRWMGRLGALTWALEEFCKEGEAGPEAA